MRLIYDINDINILFNILKSKLLTPKLKNIYISLSSKLVKSVMYNKNFQELEGLPSCFEYMLLLKDRGYKEDESMFSGIQSGPHLFD